MVSWIAWHGRSRGLADLLGGEAVFISTGRLGQRWLVPIRYLAQTVRTVAVLRRSRPDLLVVMAPPLPAVLLCLLWGALTRCAVVLDAHTGAVLAPSSGALRTRTVRVAARCAAVLVAAPDLSSRFAGSRVITLHDPLAPTGAAPDRTRDPDRPHRVVVPASWFADEPIDAVLAAAVLLPDVEVVITGRPPAGLQVPAGVRLTGRLPQTEFEELLAGADVVLALTTRESTMQRAAYEACAANVPVVVSDTRALTEAFGPAAVATGHGPMELAAAVRLALADAAALRTELASLRDRWQVAQREAADRLLRLIPPASVPGPRRNAAR